MMMKMCDFLVEEHNRFMYTLVKKTNFLMEENMNKFKSEIVLFNHFSSVLAHIEFDQCKYFAQKALREIQRNTRRLCEIVEHKVERAKEEMWLRNSQNIMSDARHQTMGMRLMGQQGRGGRGGRGPYSGRQAQGGSYSGGARAAGGGTLTNQGGKGTTKRF